MPRYCSGMETPRQILDTVGREAAAQALGVGAHRIDRATRDPKLPASWFDTLERLAGEPLPREVFAFKASA